MIDPGLAGIGVGHWTDPVARTGCTVVVLPPGTVASGEVRGGAPATREFALLDPLRTVAAVDAVVLTGGSAFGLASVDGVVDELAVAGRGFPTTAGPVPIVTGLALYDLLEGDGGVRPGPAQGAEAARVALAAAAAGDPFETGRVGAGAGATIAKWRGRDQARPAGLGGAVVRRGELVVAALVAVNAVGDVDDGAAVAAILADRFDGWPLDDLDPLAGPEHGPAGAGGEATTIGVVVTNAALDKVACHLVAQGGHGGLARALVPSHTRADGDALVAAAIGGVAAPVDVVRTLATLAVEEAVRAGAGDRYHRAIGDEHRPGP